MNYLQLLITIAPSLFVGGLIVWVWISVKSQKTYKESLARQTNLISTAGYQLRTPLNSLLGLTSNLSARSANFDKTDRDLLDKMLGSGTELKNKLIDILDIFELESGQLELDKAPHILGDTIEVLHKLRTRTATEKNLKLTVNPHPSMYNEYEYDEVRLRQVLDNLIKQCINQTQSGGVDIAVNFDRELRGLKRTWISIVVKDTSTGMSQHAADAYFLPARYMDNPFLAKDESACMALTLSKSLAKLMGGELSVFSAYSNGVEFTLKLPIIFVRALERDEEEDEEEVTTPAAERPPAPQIKAEQMSATETETPETVQGEKPPTPEPEVKTEAEIVEIEPAISAAPKPDPLTTEAPNGTHAAVSLEDAVIMVVDDNDINLQVMSAFLKRLGVQKTVNATNGQEALDLLAVERCDLILMDLQMPVMGGVTATFEIRGSDESWNSTPIIACTAAASSEDRRNCRQAGMNGFLAKPVNIEELKLVMEKALKATEAVNTRAQKQAV